MKTPIILVVDDEPDNFDVLETFLDGYAYELHYAASGQAALESLSLVQPDLILLDVAMAEMDGLAVCRHLKATLQWQSVPIIMVTALTTKQVLAQCLEAGADDFIGKPVNRLELNARVRSMLRIRQQHQQLITFNAQLETTIQQRTTQLHRLMVQDSLTQLPNRVYLLDQLTERLALASSRPVVVVIDCDQFHLVNGSFGYSFGDQLLVEIAIRLKQQNGPENILSRLGEDKFCLLLHPLTEPNIKAIEPFLQSIRNSFDRPFMVAGCEIFMTICMGIAIGQGTQQTAAELLQAADTAMYKAKLKGKGSIQLFHPQMLLDVHNRLMLETDLQRGLEHQEFITFYQPIIDLHTSKLAGFEALVRWQHPKQGLISPGLFIPTMETTGLIVPVGLLVLRQACQQLQTWHQQGWSELTMSVNLSVRQFTALSLLTDIDHVLAETQVNPACLKLEITESAIMDNAEHAIALTKALRSRQIEISIDDFGTGYSSLGYLDRFPVNNLKIDRSFVNQFKSEETHYPIVNTIVTLGQQLELSIIAEGIETQEQLSWLQNLRCDLGQGYFFSKPLPSHKIEENYLN